VGVRTRAAAGAVNGARAPPAHGATVGEGAHARRRRAVWASGSCGASRIWARGAVRACGSAVVQWAAARGLGLRVLEFACEADASQMARL